MILDCKQDRYTQFCEESYSEVAT